MSRHLFELLYFCIPIHHIQQVGIYMYMYICMYGRQHVEIHLFVLQEQSIAMFTMPVEGSVV